jgi:hypothetical protein
LLPRRYEVGRGFVARRLGIVSISTPTDFVREVKRKERIKKGGNKWRNKRKRRWRLAANKHIR